MYRTLIAPTNKPETSETSSVTKMIRVLKLVFLCLFTFASPSSFEMSLWEKNHLIFLWIQYTTVEHIAQVEMLIRLFSL